MEALLVVNTRPTRGRPTAYNSSYAVCSTLATLEHQCRIPALPQSLRSAEKGAHRSADHFQSAAVLRLVENVKLEIDWIQKFYTDFR